jgi:hypothetical protein
MTQRPGDPRAGPAQPVPSQLVPATRILAALVLATAATGCMPWVMGEDARPLEPGTVRADAGVAMLTPPYEPWRPLPVPQGRLKLGLLNGADGALSYAPPMTGHGRIRIGLHDGDPAVAAAAGWGIHGVPGVAGLDESFTVPFATGELQLSGASSAGPRWHGTLRGIVPYYMGETPAATLWLAPQVGLLLGRGGVRWAPELGLVLPTSHPEHTQLVVGLGLRWGAEPSDGDDPAAVP